MNDRMGHEKGARCLFFMLHRIQMLPRTSMDVLGCFLCLILFCVLVALVYHVMRVTVRSLRHESRPLWPWSITTYNGWNESIPAPPAMRASFPRPWVM